MIWTQVEQTMRPGERKRGHDHNPAEDHEEIPHMGRGQR